MIESGDPEALFRFFTETLNLPIAWPLEKRQGNVRGAAGAGNIILEFFRYAKTTRLQMSQARFSGIVFEPLPLSKALPEMKISGISFSAPQSQYSILPDGSRGAALTIVRLLSFSSGELSTFLYEYSDAFLGADFRRKQLGNRLRLNHGGAVGLKSIGEIVIAVSNLEKKQKDWRRLLGNPKSAGVWQVGSGPAIRLIRNTGGEDRIQEIVANIELRDKAKDVLRKKRIISADGDFIHPARAQGLRLRLADHAD